MRRRSTRTLVLATSASALATVLCFARTAPPQTSAQPTFRTGADAVLLDIVVRDKRGRPIRDLRQDEVTVLEDGTAREVKSFRLVEGNPSPRTDSSRPPPVRRSCSRSLCDGPRSSRSCSIGSAKADASWRGRRRSSSRRADLPPGQWVSVFTLDQRLTMQQDFTRDRAALTRAIEHAMQTAAREDSVPLPAESRERDARPTPFTAPGQDAGVGSGGQAGGAGGDIGAAAAQAAMNEVINRIQNFTQSAEVQQRGQSTLFPLMALAKAEGALEGRKAVLLFSEGFQVPANLEEAFRSTISEANQANVSFYAVDARGLDTGRALAAAGAALDRAGRTSQAELAKQGAGAVSLDEVMNNENAQSALAREHTGGARGPRGEHGRVPHRRTRTTCAWVSRTVTSDLASYYEIAYAPQAAPFDGRFRKVEVRVARKGADGAEPRTGISRCRRATARR